METNYTCSFVFNVVYTYIHIYILYMYVHGYAMDFNEMRLSIKKIHFDHLSDILLFLIGSTLACKKVWRW